LMTSTMSGMADWGDMHDGTWDITIVFRGYTSRDYGNTDKYPAFPVIDFIKLDRETLELHWNRASERVEALKRIDQMKDRIRLEVYRRRLRIRMREDKEDINQMIDHHMETLGIVHSFQTFTFFCYLLLLIDSNFLSWYSLLSTHVI
jgi:hypothetical protein